MLCMLIAYDASGDVVATLDHLVSYDADGIPRGLVDFHAIELAGGPLTDVWTNSSATGSKVWPEWLGAKAHAFRVELVGPPGAKRIGALVHKTSGHRRERAVIDAAIAARIAEAGDDEVDLRDVVGGPGRPLTLDDEGRTAPRPEVVAPALPLIMSASQKRDRKA